MYHDAEHPSRVVLPDLIGYGASSKPEGFEASVHRIKEQVLPRLLERVDPEAAATLNKDELAEEFRPIIGEVLAELKITLNRREQFALEKVLVDELLGLGPLEELLADPAVSDIMVNGPDQTFVERKGKLEVAQIQFRDEEHLFQIAQRIVNKVGRRVDQTTPLADARLADGSRVNVIIPPLSLRGTAISIRKFSEKPITLDMMRGFGSMSEKMATVLKIAGASRMNVVISGGTGSGKTTLLNTLTAFIDPTERVITCEDAAELLDDALGRSIRAVRASLIGEHLGDADFDRVDDLVACLDGLASPATGPPARSTSATRPATSGWSGRRSRRHANSATGWSRRFRPKLSPPRCARPGRAVAGPPACARSPAPSAGPAARCQSLSYAPSALARLDLVGGDVDALAVDQDQGVVGRQAAQVRRAHQGRGGHLPGEVPAGRRHQPVPVRARARGLPLLRELPGALPAPPDESPPP